MTSGAALGFSQLAGLRIGLWGAGVETLSLVHALDRVKIDAQIEGVAIDFPAGLASERELLAQSPLVEPARAAERFAHCDLVVRSPRVSIYRDEIRQLRASGVPVTTATGLWFAEPREAPVIAVTGSKGKSTTTSMLAHVLRRQGARVEVAGNIGLPVTDLLGRPEPDFHVIELSSFQAADLPAGPQLLAYTSLFSEHLDWHPTTTDYFADKTRIAALPEVEDVVYNADWPELRERIPAQAARSHACGAGRRFRAEAGRLLRGDEVLLSAAEFPLPGEHNLANAAAVAQLLELLGRPVDRLSEELADFAGLPYRLQHVPTSDGRTWIDDNYASNPFAAVAALRAFAGREIVLIAGGLDRHQDFGELIDEIKRSRVLLTVCVFDAGKRLAREAVAAGIDWSRIRLVDGLQRAVDLADEVAPEGSVVLDSPAAGAYDEHFITCDARGDYFKRMVESRVGTRP